MRSTFKLLFYINRNKVKSDGTTAVLCRISIDGKKSAVTTGIYCKPGDWDSKKCEIKTARENNRLAAFRSRLEEAYGNLLRNQGVVTAALLKTTVSAVSYTHLDVYKRQGIVCIILALLHRSLTPNSI